MKLQYGILGMVLVSGAAFAHDEAAEGIQVGGYVDARYTWTKDTTNQFSLAEGAIYVGKRVGATHVFIDAGLNGGLAPASSSLSVQQAYVANATDAGLTWKAGRFDTIYGWQPNDSGHYWLTDDGLLASAANATHQGLLLGYNFSDMMSLHFLINLDNDHNGASTTVTDNMANTKLGLKLDSKMEAFDLGLGFMTEKTGAGDTMWMMDVVAGTKFADYDFKAIFQMENSGVEGAEAEMGFGAQLGGMFADDLSGVARVEWAKEGEEDTTLQFTFGPQFHLEKGFVVKADYTLTSLGGEVNEGSEAGHTVAVAAVYDF